MLPHLGAYNPFLGSKVPEPPSPLPSACDDLAMASCTHRRHGKATDGSDVDATSRRAAGPPLIYLAQDPVISFSWSTGLGRVISGEIVISGDVLCRRCWSVW